MIFSFPKYTKLRKLIAAVGITTAGILNNFAAYAQTVIPVKTRIEEIGRGEGKKQIYIGADPIDEILSFPSDGEYILDGKDLNISAGKIELQGNFTFRSFAQGAQKKTRQIAGPAGNDGQQGGQGAAGERGQNSGNIAIRALEIIGPGRLIILAEGEQGGVGQAGGSGGRGLRGPDGDSRKCGKKRRPTDGAPGAQGHCSAWRNPGPAPLLLHDCRAVPG
ncbi:hypothetical protein FV234_25670, partial [Methylobacterium sp. WL8]